MSQNVFKVAAAGTVQDLKAKLQEEIFGLFRHGPDMHTPDPFAAQKRQIAFHQGGADPFAAESFHDVQMKGGGKLMVKARG